MAEKLAASPAYLDLNPQSSGWDTLVLFRQKVASGEGLTAAEEAQQASLNAYFDHFIPVIAALREMGMVDRMGFGSDAARSIPSSGTWSTASRSRAWPGSRRWSRFRW